MKKVIFILAIIASAIPVFAGQIGFSAAGKASLHPLFSCLMFSIIFMGSSVFVLRLLIDGVDDIKYRQSQSDLVWGSVKIFSMMVLLVGGYYVCILLIPTALSLLLSILLYVVAVAVSGVLGTLVLLVMFGEYSFNELCRDLFKKG